MQLAAPTSSKSLIRSSRPSRKIKTWPVTWFSGLHRCLHIPFKSCSFLLKKKINHNKNLAYRQVSHLFYLSGSFSKFYEHIIEHFIRDIIGHTSRYQPTTTTMQLKTFNPKSLAGQLPRWKKWNSNVPRSPESAIFL